MSHPLNIGIVGAGTISRAYPSTLTRLDAAQQGRTLPVPRTTDRPPPVTGLALSTPRSRHRHAGPLSREWA